MLRFIKHIIYFTIICNILIVTQCHAQDSQDSFFLAKKKGWLGKLGKAISTNPDNNNSADSSIFSATKNSSPYILYNGAFIKNIYIKEIDFGESINDTSFHNKNFLTKAAEALHVVTRKKTIRNNLFFKESSILSPTLLADNVRYLRNLPFLQDAKILIRDLSENHDTIDLIVLYKDVFSISASGQFMGTALFLQAQVDNLSGSGDRLQFSTFMDPVRVPVFGYGAEYLKRNIKGTFVNITAGYQNLNNAFNNGLRYETDLYVKAELPLPTPYYLWTGAVEAYQKFSNHYYLPDSLYNSDFKYSNYSYDAWIGYNVTGKKLLHETSYRKAKEFIAFRASKIKFTDVPNIYKNIYNYQYANVTSLLASFTLFKQEYYKTNYIYGFGRNEDVPEGYNASIISGWSNNENNSRPYVGLSLQKNYFTKKQGYFNYTAKAGGYFYQGSLQDIGILLGLESFDRLRIFNKRWFQRNFFSASYTQQINTALNEPLRINSTYGIPSYNNILNLYATVRATLNYEFVLYSRWKVLGFGFAPFTGTSLSYIKPKGENFFNGNVYSSISAGFRTRNEALIFGTIEFRCTYFPITINNMMPWNFTISTDLRFKYNSQFINRPDFVSLN